MSKARFQAALLRVTDPRSNAFSGVTALVESSLHLFRNDIRLAVVSREQVVGRLRALADKTLMFRIETENASESIGRFFQLHPDALDILS